MGFRELARWRIFSESLANGLWRTDTLKNLWPIFDECLANGIWGTDTLANLWRMGFRKLAVGQSLANLWRMVCGELTRWRIFGHYFANLWRIFGGWLLGN